MFVVLEAMNVPARSANQPEEVQRQLNADADTGSDA
jgi:hypothetical protein